MVALSVAAVAALAVPSPALAGPRVEQVTMRFGIVAELTGVGCAPATLSRPSTGDDALSFDPAIGQDVGIFDSVVVTAATLGGGYATWTVHPTADECAYYADVLDWTWSTDDRPWAVAHRTSAYTIRASRHDGTRSIAGFRVNRYTRRTAPTIRRARRHFGKPSSLRRRYGVGCRARWKRIGLTIDLINLGGRHPCRHGFVQAGRVRGPAASRWTVLVANDPGVALGTTAAFLDAESVGEPGDSHRTWTLADVWIPYGDAGHYPSVSALLSRRGAVAGFEFWVGAGGD
jgi:hypothetical protein